MAIVFEGRVFSVDIDSVYEMQRAVAELSIHLANIGPAIANGKPGGSEDTVRDLARGVNQLVTQMRNEQKVVREWVDEQSAQSGEIGALLRELTSILGKRS